jgi:hypothetical protein
MSSIPRPEAGDGPSPTLPTLHEVEEILRRARARDEAPLSLAEIERRMEAKQVRHATLRACVDGFVRLGFATEDPGEGVMWTLHEGPDLWGLEDAVELA